MKVAIVGDSVSTRSEAPFDDPTWEIWGIATGFHLRRCTRIFEIHDPAAPAVASSYADGPYGALMRSVPRRFPGVVMYRHPDERVMWTEGNILDFPFDRILALYGRERSLLTSSVAWIAAFALTFRDLETLGFWGVDMDGASEYGSQRQGGEHWVGFAKGRGVDVVIPRASLLCATPRLYGLEDAENAATLERIDDREHVIRTEIEQLEKDEQFARIAVMQMQTRADELVLWEKLLPAADLAERRATIAEQRAKWEKDLERVLIELHELNSRIDEVRWERTNWTIPPASIAAPAARHPSTIKEEILP